jgi:hypothetical protein
MSLASRHCTFAFLFLLVALCAALRCPGQDFRIDTEVFVGDKKEPVAETLTLFSNGLVYDFIITGPEEITMLDLARGRLTLIDTTRRIKCGLATQDVLSYILAFDTHAAENGDPLFAFAASPKFETTVEEFAENGQQLVRLRLSGRPLTYEAVGRRPERPEAVRALRSFADWYARLNAMRPGNLPPGARIELNKALAERDLIPLEVTRTVAPASPLGGKVEFRSRHLLTWALSGEDRKKIDRAGTCLAAFQSVSFDKYRSPTAPPVAQTAAKKAGE